MQPAQGLSWVPSSLFWMPTTSGLPFHHPHRGLQSPRLSLQPLLSLRALCFSVIIIILIKATPFYR